jgi:hypothetical protein
MNLNKALRILVITLFTLTFVSCGVSIKSVVDNQNPKVYNNLLFVIPKPDYFKFFVPKFQITLEEQLKSYNVKYDIHIVEPKSKKLELDSEQESIPNELIEDKDLIIYLLPRNVFILDNLIRNFDYEIIGVSTESEKEVWKSFMEVKCQFGPSSQKEKIAQIFLTQMNKDGVIK